MSNANPEDIAREVATKVAEMPPAEWRFFRRIFLDTVGETMHPGQENIHRVVDNCRVALVSGGERAGKSRFAAQYLASSIVAPFLFAFRYLATEYPGLSDDQISEIVHSALAGRIYWLVGPTYEQTREEFQYALSMLTRFGWVEEPEPKNVSMPKDGSWSANLQFSCQIQTKSAEDERKLASLSPHIIIMCEAAQQTFEAFLRCRSRVGETRGRVLLIGTHEPSAEWFAELYEELSTPHNKYEGAAFSLPSWLNEFIYPGGREDPEILAMETALTPEAFLERVAATPVRRLGLVVPEFSLENNVSQDAEYIPGAPVWLAVDPGYSQDSPYAVIALHRVQRNDRVMLLAFDELYETARTGAEMVALCAMREWWKDVIGIVIDVAARQHHAGLSQEEMWRLAASQHGKRTLVVMNKKVGQQELIEMYRVAIRNPMTGAPSVLINPRCKRYIREHSLWRYPKSTERGNVATLPMDRDNHAIKAVGYYIANCGLPYDVPRRAVALNWQSVDNIAKGTEAPGAQEAARGIATPFIDIRLE